jgi:hypothetical protein
MAETVSIDRPSVAKPVSRPRSRKPAVVSAVGISAAPRLQQDLCRQNSADEYVALVTGRDAIKMLRERGKL